MNLIQRPSLEDMATVKVISMLLNHREARSSIKELNYPAFKKISVLQAIENKLIKNIENIDISLQLKLKICCWIKPMLTEIVNWMDFHDTYINLTANDLPRQFQWTPYGTINKEKTAENLIEDMNIDPIARYKVACIYCYSHIKDVWQELHEKNLIKDVKQLLAKFNEDLHKERDQSEETLEKLPYGFQIIDICFLFGAGMCEKYAHSMISQMNRFNVIWCHGFEASSSNYADVDFTVHGFGLKTVPTAIMAVIELERPPEYEFWRANIYEIMYYLFLHISEEDQISIFKKHPSTILIGLLDWPRQNFFLETAKRMHHFLCKGDYEKISEKITQKIRGGYKDFNYQLILEEFQKLSPVT